MTATITPIRSGIALRPPGHGAGLEGGPCRERVDDPDFRGARWRMCFRCGRVTRRLDGDGIAWCGGALVGVAT